MLPSPDHAERRCQDRRRRLWNGRSAFVAGVYDFVLIDCPAGLDELNLVTADYLRRAVAGGDAGCSGLA